MPTLEEFKQKYNPVLQLIAKGGVRLEHLHVQDDKLVMTGAAHSQDVVNSIWNTIKSVDPNYGDLLAEFKVDASVPVPPPEATVYTVQAGDSLWKISSKFYGDGSKFRKIIEANPNKLKDEHSVIHPGDQLTIPPK